LSPVFSTAGKRQLDSLVSAVEFSTAPRGTQANE
jgi:hypothetical protein